MRTNPLEGITSGRLFWDFSESYGQILVVAQFKIISEQGASDELYGRSRKISFVFQFLLRSVSLNRPKIPENGRW